MRVLGYLVDGRAHEPPWTPRWRSLEPVRQLRVEEGTRTGPPCDGAHRTRMPGTTSTVTRGSGPRRPSGGRAHRRHRPGPIRRDAGGGTPVPQRPRRRYLHIEGIQMSSGRRPHRLLHPPTPAGRRLAVPRPVLIPCGGRHEPRVRGASQDALHDPLHLHQVRLGDGPPHHPVHCYHLHRPPGTP